MSLTAAEILALIDARAAADATFAGLVAERRAGNVLRDLEIAAALSAGRVRPVPYLITTRGIRRVLGGHEGRLFVQALRAAAAAVQAVPDNHVAYDDLWWLAELLPDTAPGGAGVDIGAAETRVALRGLAALGPALGLTPVVTEAHCAALEAASSEPDPITPGDVSLALADVA